MDNNSLLGYLREDLGELLREPNINKKGEDLEHSLAEAYEPLRSELNGLGERQREIFDIYIDAKDISGEHVQRYLEGIKTLEEAPYDNVDPNSLRDRVLNKTRGWYKKKEGEDNTKLVPIVDIPCFISLLGSIVGGVVGVIGAVSEGNPMYLTIPIAPALTCLGLDYVFNIDVPELKPLERRFEKDGARDYVIELGRLHRLTQEIEREVEDINTLTGKERKDFIRKYGSERIEREKVSLKRLTSEERESRVLEYGAREIEERINRAKREVTTVKSHIEKIIGVAEAEILPLEEDYVPHGERVYNGEKEDLEIVDRALQESQLEDQLKQLREKRLREEKIKQGISN